MTLLIEQISALKLLPLITLDRAEDIIPLGKVLVDNGLPIAEIAFRTDAAAEAIRRLRATQPDMLIGAGTVLTPEQVGMAKAAGADFIVTPGFNPNTVKVCRDLDIPVIPGVNSPSSIEAALEMGLTTLKFFPAEASGGVKMIEALLGPYYQLKLLPTGGINADNIGDYLAISGVIACGGSWMVKPSLINAGRWDELGHLIREAVGLVREQAAAR